MDTEGIGKNIFNIIDACYYLGRDATREPEPDAKDGEYALVYGPDKEIMDTGWSEENAWIGPHTSTVRWFTNSIASQPLVIEYHWMDKEGNGGSIRKEIPFMNDISDEFGNSAGKAYFFENYQYRIILKSNINVAETEYVAVDTMRILPGSIFDVTSNITGSSDGELPGMPHIEAGQVNCYTDGSAHTAVGTVTLEKTPEYYFPVVSTYIEGIYVARVHTKSSNSFVVAVWRTDDVNFNGGVSVDYVSFGWYVPYKLK